MSTKKKSTKVVDCPICHGVAPVTPAPVVATKKSESPFKLKDIMSFATSYGPKIAPFALTALTSLGLGTCAFNEFAVKPKQEACAKQIVELQAKNKELHDANTLLAPKKKVVKPKAVAPVKPKITPEVSPSGIPYCN